MPWKVVCELLHDRQTLSYNQGQRNWRAQKARAPPRFRNYDEKGPLFSGNVSLAL